MLRHPDFNRPFRLECDASDKAIGSILLQQDELNEWHPFAFESRKIQTAEKNYSVTGKEMLSLIYSLTKWRP